MTIKEHLIFYIQRLFSSKYILKGKCKKCGQCCRNIVFYLDNKLVTTEEEFEELKRINKRFNHFYISGKDGDRALLFTCKSIQENNLCKHYFFRSLYCRNYPHLKSEFITKGGVLLDNCGYSIDVDKKFDEYLKK